MLPLQTKVLNDKITNIKKHFNTPENLLYYLPLKTDGQETSYSQSSEGQMHSWN